ncbi:MAG: tetratricopeptide repeat protein [Methylobacter sp.]
MSFFTSLTKNAKLNSTIKQTAEARKSEGSKADQLFKNVYKSYAEILSGDTLRAQALYNWGFALLHQAKTKAGDEAAAIYQEAIDKFSFCRLIDPNYLGAAIDGGVAFMDMARLKAVDSNDDLYEKAKKQFEKANAIQPGAASYNLACIYGLRGDTEACLKALENSRDNGSLPEIADILSDPDMASVKGQSWFIEFIESLKEKPEAVTEKKESAEELSVEKNAGQSIKENTQNVEEVNRVDPVEGEKPSEVVDANKETSSTEAPEAEKPE